MGCPGERRIGENSAVLVRSQTLGKKAKPGGACTDVELGNNRGVLGEYKREIHQGIHRVGSKCRKETRT